MQNILVFNQYSQTIRQVPQNYIIASNQKGYWMLDFDLSADKELVLRVCEALFTYENRYCTGIELLSKVTPNEEFINKQS